MPRGLAFVILATVALIAVAPAPALSDGRSLAATATAAMTAAAFALCATVLQRQLLAAVVVLCGPLLKAMAVVATAAEGPAAAVTSRALADDVVLSSLIAATATVVLLLIPECRLSPSNSPCTTDSWLSESSSSSSAATNETTVNIGTDAPSLSPVPTVPSATNEVADRPVVAANNEGGRRCQGQGSDRRSWASLRRAHRRLRSDELLAVSAHGLLAITGALFACTLDLSPAAFSLSAAATSHVVSTVAAAPTSALVVLCAAAGAPFGTALVIAAVSQRANDAARGELNAIDRQGEVAGAAVSSGSTRVLSIDDVHSKKSTAARKETKKSAVRVPMKPKSSPFESDPKAQSRMRHHCSRVFIFLMITAALSLLLIVSNDTAHGPLQPTGPTAVEHSAAQSSPATSHQGILLRASTVKTPSDKATTTNEPAPSPSPGAVNAALLRLATVLIVAPLLIASCVAAIADVTDSTISGDSMGAACGDDELDEMDDGAGAAWFSTAKLPARAQQSISVV